MCMGGNNTLNVGRELQHDTYFINMSQEIFTWVKKESGNNKFYYI